MKAPRFPNRPAAPGHHVVLDESAGVLVAGDALCTEDGIVMGLLPTTEDVATAEASLRVIAGYAFDTLLPGRGDPIIGVGWDALAESLDAG